MANHNHLQDSAFLFEVSWEVCNKVGGIHTVLRSKAGEALEAFGDRYCMIGPSLPQNVEFEETDEPCWRAIREPLAVKGLECRFGRWTIPGRPKVILVNPGTRLNKDQILFHLWEKFGVDSLAGEWDYLEPVLFATTCAEIIATVVKTLANSASENVRCLAHFHEWMTGAGILYLKEKAPTVATIFTTHATVLGRSMMGAGRDLYGELDTIAPFQEAKNYGVVAKHSMECVSAREADCFTAVSDITAREAQKILGRKPAVTENGINLADIPDLSSARDAVTASRTLLLDFARRFLKTSFPDDTRLFGIAGRYEYSNKGIDVFLDALTALRDQVPEGKQILAYLFVLGGHMEPHLDRGSQNASNWPPPVCTHRLQNEPGDPILAACMQKRLVNQPGDRVKVIFCPVYLSEGDGIFNRHYYDLLQGLDFAVYPSKYEPWGYTPLESSAHAVPTVTTDLAGFGLWVKQLVVAQEHPGVYVLARNQKSYADVVADLTKMLLQTVSWTDDDRLAERSHARKIAERADWADFYQNYIAAYRAAQQSADKRAVAVLTRASGGGAGQIIAATTSMQPHFRAFAVETEMPKPLARLRELAYNLWWCWQPEAVELFSRMNPALWESSRHNPVKMLDQLPAERLAELAQNEGYIRSYKMVMERFDAYMKDTKPNPKLPKSEAVSFTHPVAYISTEFGIHESLPIYSGGLGVLSGDHLKSASDVNIPLIGVSLFYKHGYFSQRIDAEGNQVPEYVENVTSQLPMRQIRDDNGVPTLISVDLPGRTLYAAIWKLQVGRITLYLLDSDVPSNTLQDQHITDQLYVGDERTRIEQEILLGIGGARMLRRLGIKPCIFHLNEGHSAFLILENIRHSMHHLGMSFDEAREFVKSQVVFTTHTPVEAGNERFPRDLMMHYFAAYVKEVGISPERLMELGRLDAGDNQPFIMTILALKLSNLANGVSELHGRMSRKMWETVWNGMHRSMVPITHITNGVHIQTFIAPEMHALLDTYLGTDWNHDLLDEKVWSKIRAIPDQNLWETRCSLRQELIAFVREYVTEHWDGIKGGGELSRDEVVNRLRGSSLTIGFARRFAPYKRACLLFQDLDRLDRIVNNPRRPVQFIFAGKAHPKDSHGGDLVRQVVNISRDKRFAGRVVFVENYDLAVAKKLVQGVDVWLNTPRRPYEASGTSGQKVPVNGGINLSVADGWWCEGALGDNGWTIGPDPAEVDEDTISNDSQDIAHLYSLLEDVIVPLFYQRNNKGLPDGWLQIMRRSLETNVPRFNTHRMLVDYARILYKPSAERHQKIAADQGRLARELAAWKGRAASRFSSLHILDIATSGITDGLIQIGETFTATVRLDLGEFDAGEIAVDLIIGRTDPKQQIKDAQILPMKLAGKPENRTAAFSTSYKAADKGGWSYGIRVMPCHADLGCKAETGLVLWA